MRKEVGRLPVRDAGKDDAIDVGENLRRRPRPAQGSWRQLGADFSRLHARQNGKSFDPGMVIGNPVHNRVALAAELLGRHVKDLGSDMELVIGDL
jgi:hypothetical protein